MRFLSFYFRALCLLLSRNNNFFPVMEHARETARDAIATPEGSQVSPVFDRGFHLVAKADRRWSASRRSIVIRERELQQIRSQPARGGG